MKKNSISMAFFFVVVAFILTMSVLMSIFFAVDEHVVQKKSNIPMYVFFNLNTNLNIVNRVSNDFKLNPNVKNVKLIDKDRAFNDMVGKFSINKSLFNKNPFPYSLEIFFEPNATNLVNFKNFKKSALQRESVDDVRFPKKFLQDMETVHSNVLMFSKIIISILYAVEFVVFLSITTILYYYNKEDFDTLKFFGIKRGKIFGIFLRNTMSTTVFASIFSVFFIIAVYFLYDKYANIQYINKELFKSSLQTTFILNLSVGFLFTFFSSAFVFIFKDEKV